MSMKDALYGRSGFNFRTDGWGKATREPKWQDVEHGVVSLISNPNTRVRRGKKNNKWESLSHNQEKKEAQATAPTTETMVG